MEPRKESILSRVAGRPAVGVGLLVALSTLVRAALAVGVPSPWILPDEILYSDLAKSIAEGRGPEVHGIRSITWGVVYPAILAPAWALFDDPVTAYRAALTINAAVMSLAAVPAYLLARLFVPPRSSLLVAAMTLLVPSMSYTGVLMTENAAYPLFLTAVWLMARALNRASVVDQALFMLCLGVLALTRVQTLALVPAYLAAIATFGATLPRGEGWPYMRRFAPTAAVISLAAISPSLMSIASGEGALDWLGPRSGTFDALDPTEVPLWFAYLSAGLVLYVAVVGITASAVVARRGLSRGAPDHIRLFAAVAVPVVLAMLGSVSLVSASVDVDGTENLNERYVFYVAPLLLLGLAIWVKEGLARPRPLVWIVLSACGVLCALLPIGRLEHNASFQSPALMPWIGLSLPPLALAVVLALFVLGCGLLWLRTRRSTVGRLWVVIAITMVVASAAAYVSNRESAADARMTFAESTATWVDDAVEAGARVVVLWDERRSPSGELDPLYPWVMVAEFFNRSLGTVYRIGAPSYYESVLPTVPLRIGSDSTLSDAAGNPVAADYVVVTCRVGVDGDVVSQASDGVLRLVRVGGPIRLTPDATCADRK